MIVLIGTHVPIEYVYVVKKLQELCIKQLVWYYNNYINQIIANRLLQIFAENQSNYLIYYWR